MLVCYHDLTLKSGTNVAEFSHFANKSTNYTGVIDEDGRNVTFVNEFFIKDFTFEELQQLRVVQKVSGIRPQYLNNLFTIPRFEEYLSIVHHAAYRLKKPVGIIPEIKHPMWHNQDYPNSPRFMEDLVLSTLNEFGYTLHGNSSTESCKSPLDNEAPIQCGHLILQSFEHSCIKYLAEKTENVDKMMLIDNQLVLLTRDGLKDDVAPYAQYYSLWKELLYTGIEAQLEFEKIEYDKELISKFGIFF